MSSDPVRFSRLQKARLLSGPWTLQLRSQLVQELALCSSCLKGIYIYINIPLEISKYPCAKYFVGTICGIKPHFPYNLQFRPTMSTKWNFVTLHNGMSNLKFIQFGYQKSRSGTHRDFPIRIPMNTI